MNNLIIKLEFKNLKYDKCHLVDYNIQRVEYLNKKYFQHALNKTFLIKKTQFKNTQNV